MKSDNITKIMLSFSIITVIAIITILVILLNMQHKTQNNTLEKPQEPITEVTIVKNRNDFFTVANCIAKYLPYLTQKDSENLYNFLDNDYKIKNNITKENVLNKIQTLDDFYKFKARQMYETKISDDITQYFVYGTLTVETTEDDEEETKFYISVKLDKQNNTFSVIPNQYIDNMKVVE